MSTFGGPVVCAGHVCLDIIPEFLGGDLPAPGALAQVGTATVSTGGSVSNTGLGLHRIGVPVRLAGRVGDDAFGREVAARFDAAGRGLGCNLRVSRDEPTSYTVVLNPVGVDRMFLHCPGVNETFRAADVDASLFSGAWGLHFGYPPIMRRMCDDGGNELASLFARAKSANLRTSLDFCGIDPSGWAGRTNWLQLFRNVLPHVDVFMPSLDETLAALRVAGDAARPDAVLLRDVSRTLLDAGSAVVLLKMGELGLYLRTSADTGRVRAAGLDPSSWADHERTAATYDVPVVGTTGAGDTTIAGFLTGLWRGLDPAPALDLACAAGAFCVGRPDAVSGLKGLDELLAFVASGPPRRVARIPGLIVPGRASGD